MIQSPNKKTNKGYTLLFAVLVSSLILAIGISILTISRKEFLLATSARDSALAFYAADGGVECATYNDKSGDQNERDVFNPDEENMGDFKCDIPNSGVTAPSTENLWSSPTWSKTFRFQAKVGEEFDNACARVSVTKRRVAVGPDTDVDFVITTEIDSRGYNSGWDQNIYLAGGAEPCSVQSAKRVERGFYFKR